MYKFVLVAMANSILYLNVDMRGVHNLLDGAFVVAGARLEEDGDALRRKKFDEDILRAT